MNEQSLSAGNTGRSRREFLKTSTLVLAGGSALAASAPLAFATPHVGGSDVLKIGLIGCGDRGSGAAVDALRADKNTKLVAMADLFADRLANSLAELQKSEEVGSRIAVPKERQFVGFDAYQQLIASGVDVVLLATPPHFRPLHLKAAVDAGKHVFTEKPVAVDAPGVRSVLATCEEAKKKSLSIVSGLCVRHLFPFKDYVKRIHDGAIGDIHTLQANDYRGTLWVKKRKPEWTEMEYQTRNWYYFTWLSGDFNVEQHVHMLDTCAWIMKDQYPVSAIGIGGRQVRTGPEYGNIFDHHSVVYEYADGAKLFANTRQMAGCAGEVGVCLAGSKGLASLADRKGGVYIIADGKKQLCRIPKNDPYLTEHEVLFASIRSGTPVNNGEYMSKSTLLAILGRMATYTGQKITWEQALTSKEDLTPPGGYKWGPTPIPSVAIPGVTQFL